MIANDKALVKASANNGIAKEPVAEKRGLFAFLDPARRWLDERQLKRSLDREFRTARDFQSNGLPAGSKEYQAIHRRSCDAIAGFSKRWNVPLEIQAMETPALYGLQKLAYPEKQRQAGRVVVLLLLALAAAAAIGAFTGTVAGAHQVIRRLIGG